MDSAETRVTGSQPQFAQVLVNLEVPHLDHPFDYAIPEALTGKIQTGSLVQVRFAGRRVDGWVASTSVSTSFRGRVAPILKQIAPLPLISANTWKVANYLAMRFGARTSQILAFVVPPRRASVEKQLTDEFAAARQNKTGIFELVEPSRNPRRSVTTCLGGEQFSLVTKAVLDQKARGRSSLVVAPTATQSKQFADVLQQVDGLRVGHIDTEQPPADRYRTYLQAILGNLDVLVGTRSAMWTPLARLGGIILWDSGDDRLREQRSPRFDALDVAVARSHLEGVDLLLAAHSRSVRAQALVDANWAMSNSPSRVAVLATAPKLRIFDDFSAEREGVTGRMRLPGAAFTLVRQALESGSVLVQVPAAGYITEVHDSADGSPPASGERTRVRIGSDRIREELARAFPETQVLVSSATSEVVRTLPAGNRIVVATAGAEPIVEGGYAAVVITEANALAYRDTLDALVEAGRRWLNALALATPRASAMLIGSVPEVLEDALVNWSPQKVAEAGLQQRRELGFPPARWVVTVSGKDAAVEMAFESAKAVLGPARLAMPGEDLGDLAVLGQFDLPEKRRSLVLSAAPARTTELMESLWDVQIQLSKSKEDLLSFEVNPSRLVPAEE